MPATHNLAPAIPGLNQGRGNMGHAVRVVLIIPCVAIVFGFAAFGGGAAQAQSTNAAGAEFDGLCRQRGGVPSGNQCLIAPSAPAPAPLHASNLCDALRQTYQGYLAAAAQDVGGQSAVDLDQQGANSILDAYNRGNCAKGGASATGGTALRDQVRQQLANRSLGAQMNAVNPNGFGQSYVPVTAPGGT